VNGHKGVLNFISNDYNSFASKPEVRIEFNLRLLKLLKMLLIKEDLV